MSEAIASIEINNAVEKFLDTYSDIVGMDTRLEKEKAEDSEHIKSFIAEAKEGEKMVEVAPNLRGASKSPHHYSFFSF